MSLVVNTNLFSLNAQRNLSKAQNPLQTAMQRLSSTLRINSAKDDAAGLAIATKQLAQIRGLSQAVRNANDGISFAQTAEGALEEAVTNLQRIRELAVQSAQGTYSDSQRQDMNKEVTALAAEIDRLARDTNLGGTTLLDGSFGSKAIQVGSDANQTVSLTLGGIGLKQIGLADSYTVYGGKVGTTVLAPGDLQFKVKGKTYSVGTSVDGITTLGQTCTSAWAKAIAINKLTATTGITATASDTTVLGAIIKDREVSAASQTSFSSAAAATATTASTVSFTLTGSVGTASISVDFEAGDDDVAVFGKLKNAINAKSASTGITATSTTGSATTLVLNEVHATDIQIQGLSANEQAITGLVNTLAVGLAPAIAVAITINNQAVAYTLGASQWSAHDRVTAMMDAINEFTDKTGVTASIASSGNQIQLTAKGGAEICISGATGADTYDAITVSGYVSDVTGLINAVGMHEGSLTLTANNAFSVDGNSGVLDNAGLTAQAAVATSNVDISTVESANRVLAAIDSAMQTVVSQRSDLGAIMNRLDSTVRNLENVVENVTASRSRIMDADFASETANLTKAMITQQAGISILSQANTIPQQVLTLLGR